MPSSQDHDSQTIKIEDGGRMLASAEVHPTASDRVIA